MPKIREIDGRREVLDPVRRKYVALTPEEWVRQCLISHLVENKGYPIELLQVETAITLNGMSRRCDVVVHSRQHKPVMIIECKKQGVAIDQKVADQACRYNLVLQVPYLLLSNGTHTICLKVNPSGLTQLQEIPNYSELE